MRILVLSQVYWPDTVAVAQHLADLCGKLAKDGHEVEVWTSQYHYEDVNIKYPISEKNEGVKIRRLKNTGFGKKSVWRRLMDFFTFNFLIGFNLLFLKSGKFDVVLGLTSPPLLSFLAARFAKAKKYKFCYWTMDLQPELSIQSGLIQRGSMVARVLTFLGDYTFKKADKIIALDKYMEDYSVSRGAEAEKVSVIPVWPVMAQVYEGERMANPFRKDQGFEEKIVIMYSGNHSFVHPIDTILKVAKELEKDSRFLFVFIGGGVRKEDVTKFKQEHSLANITQLPYQPRENIHNSLGSSDYQVVILGDGQVGYTHPNKVYGAMFIGKPILYVGPTPSHVTDILEKTEGNIAVPHGSVNKIRDELLKSVENVDCLESVGKSNRELANQNFHPKVLLEKMTQALESIPTN
ncbi:MAG: colanic acid biosynthesis glycosyl transferase WcaI [Arenicella sp.]|jgi:colanic acid biosynthesis glycosyl transferase WcaI